LIFFIIYNIIYIEKMKGEINMKEENLIILKFLFALFIIILLGLAIRIGITNSKERMNKCLDNGGKAITDYFGFFEKCIYEGDN